MPNYILICLWIVLSFSLSANALAFYDGVNANDVKTFNHSSEEFPLYNYSQENKIIKRLLEEPNGEELVGDYPDEENPNAKVLLGEETVGEFKYRWYGRFPDNTIYLDRKESDVFSSLLIREVLKKFKPGLDEDIRIMSDMNFRHGYGPRRETFLVVDLYRRIELDVDGLKKLLLFTNKFFLKYNTGNQLTYQTFHISMTLENDPLIKFCDIQYVIQ